MLLIFFSCGSLIVYPNFFHAIRGLEKAWKWQSQIFLFLDLFGKRAGNAPKMRFLMLLFKKQFFAINQLELELLLLWFLSSTSRLNTSFVFVLFSADEIANHLSWTLSPEVFVGSFLVYQTLKEKILKDIGPSVEFRGVENVLVWKTRSFWNIKESFKYLLYFICSSSHTPWFFFLPYLFQT